MLPGVSSPTVFEEKGSGLGLGSRKIMVTGSRLRVSAPQDLKLSKGSRLGLQELAIFQWAQESSFKEDQNFNRLPKTDERFPTKFTLLTNFFSQCRSQKNLREAKNKKYRC